MYVGALVISDLLSGSLYRMATLKTISLLRSDLAAGATQQIRVDTITLHTFGWGINGF